MGEKAVAALAYVGIVEEVGGAGVGDAVSLRLLGEHAGTSISLPVDREVARWAGRHLYEEVEIKVTMRGKAEEN